MIFFLKDTIYLQTRGQGAFSHPCPPSEQKLTIEMSPHRLTRPLSWQGKSPLSGTGRNSLSHPPIFLAAAVHCFPSDTLGHPGCCPRSPLTVPSQSPRVTLSLDPKFGVGLASFPYCLERELR